MRKQINVRICTILTDKRGFAATVVILETPEDGGCCSFKTHFEVDVVVTRGTLPSLEGPGAISQLPVFPQEKPMRNFLLVCFGLFCVDIVCF